MEVGDYHLGLLHGTERVLGDQVTALVVVFRVVRQEGAQPVADDDARGCDQEVLDELPPLRMPDRVDRLPGDQHGHHGGLASPSSHFQRKPEHLGVGLFVGPGDVAADDFVLASAVGARRHQAGHLGQPHYCFRCLDLAEEEAVSVELVAAPVLQQASRLRRYSPDQRNGPCASSMGLVGGSRVGAFRSVVVVEVLRWSLTDESVLQSVHAVELLVSRWLLSDPHWYTIPSPLCLFLAAVDIRLDSGRPSSIGYDRVSRLWYCIC